MQARIVIQLIQSVCEHCPADDKSWDWRFRIVTGEPDVDLIVRCKVCGIEMVIPSKQLRANLKPPPSNTAVALDDAEPHRESPDYETERQMNCKPVSHSRTFTPMDREFLQALKISTADIEFEK